MLFGTDDFWKPVILHAYYTHITSILPTRSLFQFPNETLTSAFLVLSLNSSFSLFHVLEA